MRKNSCFCSPLPWLAGQQLGTQIPELAGLGGTTSSRSIPRPPASALGPAWPGALPPLHSSGGNIGWVAWGKLGHQQQSPAYLQWGASQQQPFPPLLLLRLLQPRMSLVPKALTFGTGVANHWRALERGRGQPTANRTPGPTNSRRYFGWEEKFLVQPRTELTEGGRVSFFEAS